MTNSLDSGPGYLYQLDLDRGKIIHDPEQERVVGQLQTLFQDWQRREHRESHLLGRLGRLAATVLPGKLLSGQIAAGRGLYLWGGVGRGKTYLMDLLLHALPPASVRRTHFHRFMQDIHSRLTARQGQANPLDAIASELAAQCDILCFDEFFVLDIGDAMILAGLLEALFERGIILVATSNIHPEGLYKDGLQRERFVPAIALIQQHCLVVELASATDYRLRSLTQAPLFLSPHDQGTYRILESRFCELTMEQPLGKAESGVAIEILGRQIQARRLAGDTVWFDFSQLCATARSAFDYVEIARQFHTVVLSDIPALGESENDQAKRFIALIDELYDRKVKLIASAAQPIDSLYSGSSLAFPFERTRSRLVEMQSKEYLAASHEA